MRECYGGSKLRRPYHRLGEKPQWTEHEKEKEVSSISFHFCPLIEDVSFEEMVAHLRVFPNIKELLDCFIQLEI